VSRTVALIDSDLQSHDLTLAILRDRGFRVVTARDPASALSLIREEKPALAMVDAQFLNAGSPALSAELKSLPSAMGIPVLLMSTDLARAERAVDTRRSGAQGVLYKPISPRQLSEHLGALLPEDAPGRSGLKQSRILQDLLRKVRANFADQLSEIYGDIREAILGLVPGGAQGPALSALRVKLSSLARGSDIHEFHLLGQTALGLERLVVECLEGTKTPDSTWLALVTSRLNLLGKACQDARRFVAPPPQQGVIHGSQDLAPHIPRKLFLLEDDAIWAQHLSLQLQHFGFDIQLFSDTGELAEAVGAAPPHAVVCGLTHLTLKPPEQLEPAVSS
jgi:two-component system, chemotaxis family, chemotaxis protein CheY